jgi:3-dehydroquinate synthase
VREPSSEIGMRFPGRTEACRVLVGAGAVPALPEGALVVVDARVADLHGARLPAGPRLEIEGGEGAKSVAGLEAVWRFLAAEGADRQTTVVGVGGGTITDLVGFAASTWLRGIPFAFVATTLMAQLDAALGGKNGLNFQGFKNQVGTVRQPVWVACDPAFLATLPPREYVSGLAEAVKVGLLASPGLLSFLEREAGALRARDGAVLGEVVRASVAAKAAVVESDPFEEGPRRRLNLGHTLGHAYEAVLGVSHGEAVAAGLCDACDFSVRRGLLDPAVADRVRRLLGALGLPDRLEAPAADLSAALRRDKKRQAARVHFVFLRAVGDPVVEAVDLADLDGMLAGRVGGGVG